jgi:hypothetical protein
MNAQEIIAGADRHPHEPVVERCLEPKSRKALECFHEHLLDDVLDLILAAGVSPRGREDPRLVPHDEVFELPWRPREHKPYEFFIGTGILRRQSFNRDRGIRRRF